MDNRHKWTFLIAVLLIIILSSMVVLSQILIQPPSNKYNGGVDTSYQAYGTVDAALSKYVNLTEGSSYGSGGPTYGWNTIDGEVTWIGSPEDPVKSLQNIHLAVYTELDSNDTYGNLNMRQIGLHVTINQTHTNNPPDAIDHQEIVIPTLGLDTPRFEYHFNCSTYIK